MQLISFKHRVGQARPSYVIPLNIIIGRGAIVNRGNWIKYWLIRLIWLHKHKESAMVDIFHTLAVKC